MKIPLTAQAYRGSDLVNRLTTDWKAAACKIELDYGIWIDVRATWDNNFMSRIYFLVAEHEFDSLQALRRALRNKVFL